MSEGRVEAAQGGRMERKRARTRARLIEAARELIGAGGLEALTIAEVTEAADVGFGTFYGYFASKEDLVHEVVADAAERLGAENDRMTADIDDPAEVFAVAVRHSVAIVDDDPVWATFLVRVGYSEDRRVWSAVYARMLRDLERGVAEGRFRGDRMATVPHLVAGAVLAVMRGRLEGLLGPEAAVDLAASMLVVLGLGVKEAGRIAARPMPALTGGEEEVA